MRPRAYSLAALTAVTVLGSPYSPAAEDPAFKDLTATIVLQGLPCNKVISTTRNGDSDYTAACQDGNRYHVFVDPSGRVVVKKL